MSLAGISLVTAKARCCAGPRPPFSLKSPMPNATALADARGTWHIGEKKEGSK
jgi:hypothetical protein